jgi:hypothetical protein
MKSNGPIAIEFFDDTPDPATVLVVCLLVTEKEPIASPGVYFATVFDEHSAFLCCWATIGCPYA